MDNIKLFCGNASQQLGKKIADILKINLLDAEIRRFSDGEINVNIKESVRGDDVFVIQSTCEPVNENLMELFIMIDALKRASASRITAVMPYFGYARQDRKTKSREPISAKLVADLLTTAGVDRILTMDLHAPQIQGFFNIPVDHLLGVPILASYFKENCKNLNDFTIISPDVGSVTRTRNFAQRLDTNIAIVDKRRKKANFSEVMNIIGEVSCKNVIIVDDIIDTAGTLCNAAEAIKQNGALDVYACATHGVLSGLAIDRINKSCIKELLILDTIELSEEKKLDKIKVISSSKFFAKAIENIYNSTSISSLFED